jgi:hypothetical protein
MEELEGNLDIGFEGKELGGNARFIPDQNGIHHEPGESKVVSVNQNFDAVGGTKLFFTMEAALCSEQHHCRTLIWKRPVVRLTPVHLGIPNYRRIRRIV